LLLLGASLGGCASTGDAAHGPEPACSFWPPAPDEPRVQFLRSFRTSADLEPEPSALDRIIFGEERRVLPIGKPYGIAIWEGRLYVCDITNPSVVILDFVKGEMRLMAARGVEQMSQPTDVAIAEDGRKYVVDRRLGRIFVFGADDRHRITLGEKGLVPAGIAVRGEELFVPDFATQRVVVLDRNDGALRRTIGGPGGGDGEFVRPLGVDVDDSGTLWVTDAIRGRLQRFDSAGALLGAIGELGDAPGSFVRPKHVAVDEEGIAYVVDAAFQNVQMFDASEALLMYFGGPGSFPGAMSLPAGIAVGRDGEGLDALADLVHPAFEATRLVVVTNQFGADKVSIYALGRLRPGHTVEELLPPESRSP
jgi:sugar lactone lactonase YvrE